MKDYIDLIIAICSAISIIIPLIVKLVEYIKKAVNEKNWNELVNLAYNTIITAEESFDSGEAKKSWAKAYLLAVAKQMNYAVDSNKVDELIEALVSFSKKVNA